MTELTSPQMLRFANGLHEIRQCNRISSFKDSVVASSFNGNVDLTYFNCVLKQLELNIILVICNGSIKIKHEIPNIEFKKVQRICSIKHSIYSRYRIPGVSTKMSNLLIISRDAYCNLRALGISRR